MFISKYNYIGYRTGFYCSAWRSWIFLFKVEVVKYHIYEVPLTLKVLIATIDAQWEGMGDVGSARYEPALLPPCPTIRVLSYSN